MHFPIIELTTKKKTKKEISESSVEYDNATLNYFCDYYGEEYTQKDRKELIKDDYLKELFKGIADIDAGHECVRFYSAKDISDTLDRYYREIAEKIVDTNETGWLRFFSLRKYGENFRDSSIIFVVNDCPMTSMQFFEDCYHYADTVLYFGQIYDAHC